MKWFGTKAFNARLEDSVRVTVEAVLNRVLSDTQTTLGKIRSSFDVEAQIAKLREALETLKIEKDRKDEDFARKEREIEHKVGLEQKRQEFEISQAKREATVTIREENLKAERERFEAQMKFYEEQAEKRAKALEEIIKPLLKALPSAEIIATVGNKG